MSITVGNKIGLFFRLIYIIKHSKLNLWKIKKTTKINYLSIFAHVFSSIFFIKIEKEINIKAIIFIVKTEYYML